MMKHPIDAKPTIEGRLLQLTIEPGERDVVGLMLITKDGKQDGRYIRRPENTYGSITVDGKGMGSLSLLIEAIMSGDEFVVKWESEMTANFTKEGA